MGDQCVAVVGQVGCPQGYPASHVVYLPAQVTDGRTCQNACQCGQQASSCTGTVSLYSNAACTDSVVTTPTGQGCEQAPANLQTSVSYTLTSTTSATACQPQQPTVPVQGQATGSTPFTVCCM
jgi:hypothetical protein